MAEKDKVLYKYTQLQFINKSLEYGIYASHIDRVNDPFESVGIEYANDYRICCLTKSDRQMFMWAYYTNHRGCVIEYDVSECYTNYPNLIRPVTYEEILRTPHQEMTSNEIVESLYKKSKEWNHENEYRAVYYKDSDNNAMWSLKDEEIYLKAKPTKIMLGLLAEKDDYYKFALDYIKDFNQKNLQKQISVTKCALNTRNYGIQENRQFDYLREIE